MRWPPHVLITRYSNSPYGAVTRLNGDTTEGGMTAPRLDSRRAHRGHFQAPVDLETAPGLGSAHWSTRH